MAGDAPWLPRFESLRLVVLRAIGRGAFGEVSLVKASPEGRPPAVFALKKTSLANVSEAGLEQALSEAKLLRRLGEAHPCILQCFDFHVLPGATATLELLLEYAPLGDLSSRIKKCSQAGETSGLPELEVVSYSSDVAAGLAHIHSLDPKVLHRDVKPANVVLFPTADGHDWQSGTTPRAKLADFGIAKVLEKNGSLAGAKTVIGTPHYFSPEICRGERYDERSDAWALGCVVYEMMCLHRPFHQAEGNIAVLALRVMEGRYDRDALSKRASCYDGALVLALTGLLTLEPQQRSRAVEVVEPLASLRERLAGCAPEPAVAWWEVDAAQLPAAAGGASATEATATGPSSVGADSWAGAEQVALSLGSVEELQRTGLPSQGWGRFSERTPLKAPDPATLWRTQSGPAASPDPVACGSPGIAQEEGRDATAQFGQAGSGAFLGTVSDLGGTVRLDCTGGGSKDAGSTQPLGMAAPSRLAWQGGGMFDTPEPQAENLDGASEPSSASPCTEAGAHTTTPLPSPQHRGEAHWADARIFLRPLWRCTGDEPAPADAPVIFCFARDVPEAPSESPAPSERANGWLEVDLSEEEASPQRSLKGIFELTALA